MKRIAATAACGLVLLVSACSAGESASAGEADALRQRAEALAPQLCDASGSGRACAELLDQKVALANDVAASGDVSQEARDAAIKVLSESADFTNDQCNKQEKLDMTCGAEALTVSTAFTTLEIKLQQ